MLRCWFLGMFAFAISCLVLVTFVCMFVLLCVLVNWFWCYFTLVDISVDTCLFPGVWISLFTLCNWFVYCCLCLLG